MITKYLKQSKPKKKSRKPILDVWESHEPKKKSRKPGLDIKDESKNTKGNRKSFDSSLKNIKKINKIIAENEIANAMSKFNRNIAAHKKRAMEQSRRLLLKSRANFKQRENDNRNKKDKRNKFSSSNMKTQMHKQTNSAEERKRMPVYKQINPAEKQAHMRTQTQFSEEDKYAQVWRRRQVNSAEKQVPTKAFIEKVEAQTQTDLAEKRRQVNSAEKQVHTKAFIEKLQTQIWKRKQEDFAEEQERAQVRRWRQTDSVEEDELFIKIDTLPGNAENITDDMYDFPIEHYFESNNSTRSSPNTNMKSSFVDETSVKTSQIYR